MRGAAIEEQNRFMLERQRQFRMAADVVTAIMSKDSSFDLDH